MRSSLLIWVACFSIGVFTPLLDANAKDKADINKIDLRLELKNKPPHELVELYMTTSQPAKRDVISEMIIERRKDTVPVLKNFLKEGAEKQKLFSLGLIMEMRVKEIRQEVIDLLEDRSPKVRRRSAYVLGHLKYKEAYPKLISMLKPSEDPGVAKSVLAGLGMLGDQRAVEVIQKEWLRHSDLSVSVNAAISLAALGDEEGIDKVIEASKSNDNQTRREGTFGLGFFKDPKAGERLKEIIDDPKAPWKTEAEIALSRINLSSTPPQNRLGLLKGLMEHPNKGVGKWAIDEISDMETPQAKEVLESASRNRTIKADYARRKWLILKSLPSMD